MRNGKDGHGICDSLWHSFEGDNFENMTLLAHYVQKPFQISLFYSV